MRIAHMNLNHARLPIPPFPQVGGQGWIRTTEVSDGRFTVCSLWPLGNLPMNDPDHPAQRWRAVDLEEESWRWDLNPQPADYKSAALPIELRQHEALPDIVQRIHPKSGDPEGARTLDLQRDRLAL